jgi:hypothetical protein
MSLFFLPSTAKLYTRSIFNAKPKYSVINFILVILELTDINLLIKREQYYLDKYQSPYNVLKIAGSLKNFNIL